MAKGKTFFSYSRTDSRFVLKLAKDLRDAGVALWLDQLDIKGGSRWDAAVEEALSSAPSLIVVLSAAAMKSNNVMDEVSFALENGKTIIPVLLQECVIPFRLRRLQHIDFTGDYGTGITQLLEVVKNIAGTDNADSPALTEDEAAENPPEDAATRPYTEGITTQRDNRAKEKVPPQLQNVVSERNNNENEIAFLKKAKPTEEPFRPGAKAPAYKKYLLIGAVAVVASVVAWIIIPKGSGNQNDVATPDTDSAKNAQVAKPLIPKE